MPIRNPPIRILVVGLPRMQQEIVCSLLGNEKDLDVIGCLEDDEKLSDAIRATGADLVVKASSENGVQEATDRLLQDHPRLKIVAITPDGRSAFQVELRPHVAKIHEVSSHGLVMAIRDAAHSSFLGRLEGSPLTDRK